MERREARVRSKTAPYLIKPIHSLIFSKELHQPLHCTLKNTLIHTMKEIRFMQRLQVDAIKVAKGNLAFIHSNRSELLVYMELFHFCSMLNIILYLLICSIISGWCTQFVIPKLIE